MYWSWFSYGTTFLAQRFLAPCWHRTPLATGKAHLLYAISLLPSMPHSLLSSLPSVRHRLQRFAVHLCNFPTAERYCPRVLRSFRFASSSINNPKPHPSWPQPLLLQRYALHLPLLLCFAHLPVQFCNLPSPTHSILDPLRSRKAFSVTHDEPFNITHSNRPSLLSIPSITVLKHSSFCSTSADVRRWTRSASYVGLRWKHWEPVRIQILQHHPYFHPSVCLAARLVLLAVVPGLLLLMLTP